MFSILLWVATVATPSSVQPDAIVVSDDASWTLQADGAVVEERHRRVKVLNDRAYRSHADPRVRFWNDVDKVEILAARVTQADGTVVETPDYGRNLVTPGGYSGWPAYAEAREWVISFSGVEPNAILELHWRKTTQPGARPWMWADVRVCEEDPVEQKSISVTVPEGRELRHRSSGVEGGAGVPKTTRQGGSATYRWSFAALPADPDEPQSPAWRKRAPRLTFTTCPDEKTFVAAIQSATAPACAPSESFDADLKKVGKDALDDAARLRAIQKSLKETFTLVDQAEAWERMTCRSAADVYQGNYGNPLESGALLVAMLRTAGLKASPALLLRSPEWDVSTPVPVALAAVIARVELGDRTVWLHPIRGTVSARSFPDHQVIELGGSADPAARFSTSSSGELSIQGKLKVEADGNVSGEIKLRATGHAYDPEQLAGSDEQKAYLNTLVGRVVEGLVVDSFSVSGLSDAEMVAVVKVKAAKPLASVGDRRRMALGPDFPFTTCTPVPLASVARRLPVELSGAIAESIQVRIELPLDHRFVVVPGATKQSFGDWGMLEQMAVQSASDSAAKSPASLLIERTIRIGRALLGPEEFVSLRAGLNQLRSESSRTLLVGK